MQTPPGRSPWAGGPEGELPMGSTLSGSVTVFPCATVVDCLGGQLQLGRGLPCGLWAWGKDTCSLFIRENRQL